MDEEEPSFPRTPVGPPPVKNPFSASADRLSTSCDREHFPRFSPSLFRTDQVTVHSLTVCSSFVPSLSICLSENTPYCFRSFSTARSTLD